MRIASKYFALVAMAAFSFPLTTTATTITQWDFNTQATYLTPSTGSGAVSFAGLLTSTSSTQTTGTTSDPIAPASNRVATLTALPAGGSANATKAIEFKSSTAGYSNISASFDLLVQKSASRYWQLQFTTDGANYSNVSGGTAVNPTPGTGVTTATISNSGLITVVSSLATFTSANYSRAFGYNFAGGGVDNDPSFGFRLLPIWDPSGSDYVSSGAGLTSTAPTVADRYSNVSSVAGPDSLFAGVRLDYVTISGVAVPEPSSVALLATSFGILLLRRRS